MNELDDKCLGTVKYRARYADIWYIEYDPKENCFYDSEFGHRIVDIFALVTPDELLLFRKMPEKYSYFSHRSDPNIVCKFIMNGVYDNDEEINSIMPCQLSIGRRCEFSDYSESARQEICEACGR